ncbi:PHB depolymerase family esterase [Dyella sp. M7H15-1]|uniref:PHB depolymerase family esterase n=1 Tax=Dyella sp. M7H15-1 TaxID=2501295 RepID=UPI0013E8CFC9|nr:PHB depolymerase family esterase [Dyella sp. M7H15-1]
MSLERLEHRACFRTLVPLISFTFAAVVNAAGAVGGQPTCSATGTPPLQTVEPVTERPSCKDGQVLSFDQNGVTRYACLSLPPHTAAGAMKWPMIVYLHGSMTTPDSLYRDGRALYELSRDYPLSAHVGTKGFILLAPEGRRAKPWASDSPHTGTGFHWDEWQRDPSKNLDVQAIDHFIDQVVAMGLVDAKQIYVFGWSNGANMAVLYGAWRADRIAAVGQYAGADPWQRTPCPVDMPQGRQVPLTLLRNMCDALATCSVTSSWSDTLDKQHWPLRRVDLSLDGKDAGPNAQCVLRCGKARGLYEHIRWPQETVLADGMLEFFKEHPLP